MYCIPSHLSISRHKSLDSWWCNSSFGTCTFFHWDMDALEWMPQKTLCLLHLWFISAGLTFRLNQGIWPDFDISNFSEMSGYRWNSGPSLLIVHIENTQCFKLAMLRIIKIANLSDVNTVLSSLLSVAHCFSTSGPRSHTYFSCEDTEAWRS